jgi:hypothetical protein
VQSALCSASIELSLAQLTDHHLVLRKCLLFSLRQPRRVEVFARVTADVLRQEVRLCEKHLSGLTLPTRLDFVGSHGLCDRRRSGAAGDGRLVARSKCREVKTLPLPRREQLPLCTVHSYSSLPDTVGLVASEVAALRAGIVRASVTACLVARQSLQGASRAGLAWWWLPARVVENVGSQVVVVVEFTFVAVGALSQSELGAKFLALDGV